MTYSLRAALGALMLVPLTGMAMAGNVDPAPIEPAPVPAAAPLEFGNDWTGFYLGGQIGYGDVDSSTDTLDGNGTIGGVHAAYLYDFGTYVLGGELDYDVSDIDLGTTGELDSVTRAKFKAGYDAGNTLIYGVLGAAYADATVAGAGLSDSGYVVGAGVNYQLTDNWVLGGEALYHDFGDDFDGSGVELDATTVQARLSYKF